MLTIQYRDSPSQSAHSPVPSLLGWAKVLLLAVLVYTLVVISLFKTQFWGKSLATEAASWGQVGDYFGGLVNPIIGLATVILIFISIRIQQIELRESIGQIRVANEQASQQSFEQSLFAWLANYHSLIGEIEYEGSKGRRALNKLYIEHFCLGKITKREDTKAKQDFRRLMKAAVTGTSFGQKKMWIVELRRQLRRSLDAYHKTYRDRRSDLDAAYRTIFRLIDWIDTAPIPPQRKWHYVALVRAQLSWIELIYLFFNGLTTDGAAFARLINRYALFDNLAPDSAPLVDYLRISMRHRKPLPSKRFGFEDVWGYEASGFDSNIAKARLGIATVPK